jgi:hypothetical protein
VGTSFHDAWLVDMREKLVGFAIASFDHALIVLCSSVGRFTFGCPYVFVGVAPYCHVLGLFDAVNPFEAGGVVG